MKRFFGKRKENNSTDHAPLPPALPAAVQALVASVSGRNRESADLTPVATAVGKRNREKEAAAREKEARETEALLNGKRKPSAIGNSIGGEGIFIGRYTFAYARDGLSRDFNIFAAKEDLTDNEGGETAFTYNELTERLSRLRGWHGFDGETYRNENGLYEALESGSYKGGWIVPTMEMLNGTNDRRKETQRDNLCAHKNEGELAGTFKPPVPGDRYTDYSDCYWSSTVDFAHHQIVGFRGTFAMCMVQVAGNYQDTGRGFTSWSNQNGIGRLSCRPVRLVEVKP